MTAKIQCNTCTHCTQLSRAHETVHWAAHIEYKPGYVEEQRVCKRKENIENTEGNKDLKKSPADPKKWKDQKSKEKTTLGTR